MFDKDEKSKVKFDEKMSKKEKRQNQEHNVKKEALGPNIKRK